MMHKMTHLQISPYHWQSLHTGSLQPKPQEASPQGSVPGNHLYLYSPLDVRKSASETAVIAVRSDEYVLACCSTMQLSMHWSDAVCQGWHRGATGAVRVCFSKAPEA